MRTGHARWLMLGALVLLVSGEAALLESSGARSRRAAAHHHHSSGNDMGAAAAFRALQREGLKAALDTLEQLAARDSVVLRNAHQLAHALGRQAVAASGDDPSVLSQCRPDFASGCYHGVVEGYLHARGRIEMGLLERMCGARAARDPGSANECVHGLGHGILGAVAPETRTALGYCDSLSTAGFRSACHEGVFMEAVNGAMGHAQHARHEVLNPADPYAPCDRFSDPYAASCWLFQGFIILKRSGFDPAGSFRVCDAAPGNRARRCYESMGLQLTGLFQRDNEWVLQQCAKGRPDLAPRCAAGAALALAHMDWSGVRATRFCRSAPRAWRATCYEAAAGQLADLTSRPKLDSICAALEPTYAAGCLRAAGLGSPN